MRYYLFILSAFLYLISCNDASYTNRVAKAVEEYPSEEYVEMKSSRTATTSDQSSNWDKQEDGFTGDDILAYQDNSKEQTTTNAQRQQKKERRQAKKIIRKAHLNIEVADYSSAIQKIRAIANKVDAELTSELQNNTDYRLFNYLTFRLPPERFEEFIRQIEGTAKVVVNKQISANDVTKRYNDFTTRLQVREATIQRYQEILRQAKNVPEILQVERELHKAIEERDALKGELKYLNDRVALSTVELEVYQNIEYAAQQRGFFSRLGDAISDGWHGFLGFVIGLVAAWPFVLLGSLLVVLFIRYRRKRKRKTA